MVQQIEVSDGSGFSAKVLADSISPAGARLTTMEITFPRSILAELNTHRVRSANAASSRAIPLKKAVAKIKQNPFIPIFGGNQPGMKAKDEATGWRLFLAHFLWMFLCWINCSCTLLSEKLGVHKQVFSRTCEAWMFTTVIFSATDWDNFFFLRCDPMAEPSMQKIATMMRECYVRSIPQKVNIGEWHLPFVDTQAVLDVSELLAKDKTIDSHFALQKVSAGKCARVSYELHNGKRDVKKDIELAETLIKNHHSSPLEHQATPCYDPTERHGNFKGWVQFRKMTPNENCENYDYSSSSSS